MLGALQEGCNRAIIWAGLSQRKLDSRRFQNIKEALLKPKEEQIIGGMSLETYLTTLQDDTLGLISDNKDLLWLLITNDREDLVKILLEKNPPISEAHKKLAYSINLNIWIILKKKTEPEEMLLITSALTPFFELAKNHLWQSLLLSFTTSADIVGRFINKPLEGETLLNLACLHGQPKVVNALLKLGANCYTPSPATGRFPLHNVILYTQQITDDNIPQYIFTLISQIYQQDINILIKYDKIPEEGNNPQRRPLEYGSKAFAESFLGKQMKSMENTLSSGVNPPSQRSYQRG